jgi:hypothetical protein
VDSWLRHDAGAERESPSFVGDGEESEELVHTLPV